MKMMRKMIPILLLCLLVLPVQSFAHGTGEEHQREMLANTIVFIGTAILFIIFWISYRFAKAKVKSLTDSKKQEERERRLKLTKRANLFKWGWILSLVGFLISGGMALFGGGTGATLQDIHGVGYSVDGKQVIIPAHDGLKVFSNGQWSVPEGDRNDYMGFAMVDDGFYSSGHPGAGSDLLNPLGIVKSSDEGKTIQTLGLSGESDFHGLAVSYKTHTMYVFNPEPNLKMKAPGLYYSKDDAQTWTQIEAKGLDSKLSALTAHPTNDAIIAVGTQNGVYISEDYGVNFENLLPGIQVTSLSFGVNGQLFIGAIKNQPVLMTMDIESKKTKEFTIPSLQDDAIQYSVQNPVDEKQITIATFNKDIYLSNDSGLNWIKIADQGKGISQGK